MTMLKKLVTTNHGKNGKSKYDRKLIKLNVDRDQANLAITSWKVVIR